MPLTACDSILNQMLDSRARTFGLSIAAWLIVGIFWYFATRSAHPTQHLAVVTTSALIITYAAAAYINHLLLLPRFWRQGRTPAYLGTLLTMMFALTAIALTVIRTTYLRALGPDPDPNGLAKHFAIDFIGMAVHLIGAEIAVRIHLRLAAHRA